MKLKELFKYTGGEQIIHLIVENWRITAKADALECCLNDDVLDGTITSIAAEDAALVVCAECEDGD